MLREVLKQMFPFIVLMAVLWLVAELIDRTMVSHTIVAPPQATVAPMPK
jgi:hypothetical protein